MESLRRMLDESNARRERDAEAFHQLDMDTCMLCHAHGADKRSLRINCEYAVHEVVPEALDMRDVDTEPKGYYLLVCKSCRGALLDHMKTWRDERVALRDQPKDHDGYLYDGGEHEGMVCVRKNGRIVYITEEQWRREYRA